MKKIAVLLVLCFCVISTNVACAGEAWPWVVGGVAGILTLSAINDANNRDSYQEVHHYYHQPSYATSYEGVRVRERVWMPGGYDLYGNYHEGYYTYQEVIR